MKLLKIIIFIFLPVLNGWTIKATAQSIIPLTKGMIISKSVIIKQGNYRLTAGDSINQPLITIIGNNFTVDFNHTFLKGNSSQLFPNQFHGLAVLIKGNNITIKNARISGYKIALMAQDCNGLTIENCDFSYNYRQRLQSNWQHEDVSDWMSYHHNENDEWLRYGAGIYLKDCNKAVIKQNKITGGQCALMMMRCNDGLVTDNDFSFNSAIGIGMYRSNRNFIMNNKLDFNVRGHSFGFYNRGQDSAGILAFEQCNDNVIAYNSVTHSGDGFFLWAGQTTMDNGLGGCNDNYLYKNDFSYAPTNGVEVTFSKNFIINNIINECDNGIWGGYSWNTSIAGNSFFKNKTAIAIEHGQNISISGNKFNGDVQDGIKLWARHTQPADWGYAQKRITTSMNYLILDNSFQNENNAINATLTDNIALDKNKFIHCKKDIKTDSSVTNLKIQSTSLVDSAVYVPEILGTWKNTNIPVTNFSKGRDQMKITEWGPYDFRYPIIFLKKIDSNHTYHFDILGPKGKWKIKKSKDVKNISQQSGSFPASITAQQNGTDVELELEYTGEAFTDQFGTQQAAEKKHSFSFRDFKPDIKWQVNRYGWDAAHDPNKNYQVFKTVFNNKPLQTEQVKDINYTWWGAIGKGLPADSFAVVATANINLAAGTYILSVTADDLVKVFVDDKLVIDFWDVSKYKYDEDMHHEATIKLQGRHNLRIEQAENAGFATLIFKIKPLNE